MTAQVSLISELEEVIAHGSSQRRADILLQVTNLFIRGSAQYTDDEIALFDDVITRLATEIEASVRALLAHRLAPLARAPINITRALAGDDDIRIAGPILTLSERLDDRTLLYHARTKGEAHLLAISQRKSLNDIITDVLIARGNREILLSTTKNPGAKISKTGFSVLAKRCIGDDQLATCVGSRHDIPHDVLLNLLSTASELVRSKLIAEHPRLKDEIEKAVETVTHRLRDDAATAAVNYTAAQALVRSLGESGQLTDATIRTMAEDGKIEELIASLAHMCGVPIAVVEQAFTRGQAETILIFARASRLSWPTAKALVWLRAKKHGIPAAQVERAMASYDRLNFATARQILEFYRARENGVIPDVNGLHGANMHSGLSSSRRMPPH